MNEPLDLDNLDLDEWFDISFSSLPISSLPILIPIKLDQELAEPTNTSHVVRFGAVIGLFSTAVLEESLRLLIPALLGPYRSSCAVAGYVAADTTR